jgi:hypothetical protein
MRLHFASIVVAITTLAGLPLAARAAPVTLRVTAGGTTAVQGSAPGSAVADPAQELDVALQEKDVVGLFGPGAAAPNGASGRATTNRVIARGRSRGADSQSAGRGRGGPRLDLSIPGLDHFDTRTANGGNQFSNEPPDQGLCAGNGFVLESVNTVLRVFDTAGNPVTGVVDLNTFYGYPAAINRQVSPLQFGPDVFDPTCYFDHDVQRWFHVASTLERARPTSQALSGASHIDLAVSLTADPRDGFVIYRIPAEDDGTNGTPDHHCALNAAGDPGPCFPDYPHIGANGDAIFITTNEFDFFGPGFHGAEIYAISKRALAQAASSIDIVLLDTADPSFGIAFDGIVGFPGFTVWPAQSPNGNDDGGRDGTEFLLSSQAVFNDSGVDDRLRLWSVSGTRTIDSASPDLTLAAQTVNVLTYGVPPPSTQKAGSVPLRDCLASAACSGRVVAGGPFPNLVEGPLDTNDSRMQQVYLANGKLFAALDTAVTVNGVDGAGIAWFVVNPHSAKVQNQGVLALEGVDLNYPAVAVTQSGRGVIAFTAVGPDLFPSAGFAGLDAAHGAGDVQIAAAGLGPQDGFTEYPPVGGNRPRWGDYGAAAADGSSIWMASEYIGQTCTFATYFVDSTCGGTRTLLANWGTRVSKVTP